MRQLALPNILAEPPLLLTQNSFSHNGVCDERARLQLEQRYAQFLQLTDVFNRRLVSFQANKTETLHSWIKYREGFSAQLVELLLVEFGISPGDSVLDPFAGSGTTLLTAQMLGIDAVGIELLPHCHLAWKAKTAVFAYDLAEMTAVRDLIQEQQPPASDNAFPHLTITESAFPPENEQVIMAYLAWFEQMDVSPLTRQLCRAILMSVLEDVSYTRKDGQYLRWDGRAQKIIKRNQVRVGQGKKPVKGIDKGEIPTVPHAFLQKLNQVIRDVGRLQAARPDSSRQELVEGNVLYTLPLMEDGRFQAVITSPPYANRYDYTRTYALELAYLQVKDGIFRLRQDMLSCTVENKPKLDKLQQFYASIGQEARFEQIRKIWQENEALREINQALHTRNQLGQINNKGVLRMIWQYFAELTFVFAELYRVCERGGHVAIVNDNVRYAGEVIPVDLLSVNLAEAVGFKPVKIFVLPQRKGNSSQQMSRYGRRALRKSITVWQKPFTDGKLDSAGNLTAVPNLKSVVGAGWAGNHLVFGERRCLPPISP